MIESHVVWQKATQHCKAIILQFEKEKAAASLPPSKSHVRNSITALDCMKDAGEGILGNINPQLTTLQTPCSFAFYQQ